MCIRDRVAHRLQAGRLGLVHVGQVAFVAVALDQRQGLPVVRQRIGVASLARQRLAGQQLQAVLGGAVLAGRETLACTCLLYTSRCV